MNPTNENPWPLSVMAARVDEALHPGSDPDLIRITHDPLDPGRGLCRSPLRADRLEKKLLGFLAPSRWQAVGLRCPASAWTNHGRIAVEDADDARVVTMLIDRTGHEAAIIRDGDTTSPLETPPDGMLADALRRALDLPTAPAPADTVDFLLRSWLDRLVESVAFLGSHRYASWEAVTALHPAATGSAQELSTVSPTQLAEVTHQLADEWPWERLRNAPDVLDVPRPVSHDIAARMDNGMFARWALAQLPGLDALTHALDELLPPQTTTAAIRQTVRTAGLPWPAAAPSQS